MSQLLSQCRWSEDGNYLTEIVKNKGLPLIARVTHGSYASLGQPSFTNPGVVSHVLIVSAGTQVSVIGQCVRKVKGRLTPYGPTLLIPHTFLGHFEILNEEGRPVPNILTSEGLSKTLPPACLVREPFKSCLAEVKEGSDDKIYRIGSKTRTLAAGELITIVGLVSVPSGKGKIAKYLRCVDQQHNMVFLSISSKGKFSPIASEESIGGVHSTRGILKKRLPLMVRLVEGKPPPSTRNFKFSPEIRIYSNLQEPLIFALPITPSWKDSLIPLPLSAPLKLQVAKNMDDLEGCKLYASLLHKANNFLDQIRDRIQVYDINLQKEMRFDGCQWKAYAPPIFLPSSQEIIMKEKGKTSEERINPEEEEEYDDIDELYDYVRGVKPTPPGLGNKSSSEPKSSTTLVTITSKDPDVVAQAQMEKNSSNRKQNNGRNVTHRYNNHQCSRVPNKNRHSLPEVILKDSLNRLSPRPPSPPPIETIPSRKFLGTSPQPELCISVLNSRNKETTHHHHSGTQIQIQIRSGDRPCSKHQHDNIVITTTRPTKALDSTGGSVSTTPTNTSGSAQSSSSSGSKGKGKPRTGLYIKHNSNRGSCDALNSNNSGHCSPLNRLIYQQRSPIFDYRYKSLTDLSVPPHPPGPHHHLHASGPRGSLTNLSLVSIPHVNPLIQRPKSMGNVNMVEADFIPPLKSNGGGGGSGKPSSSAASSGVKKRLAEIVMPFHSHNHNPLKSSSQRSGRHYRKASVQHSALFL